MKPKQCGRYDGANQHNQEEPGWHPHPAARAPVIVSLRSWEGSLSSISHRLLTSTNIREPTVLWLQNFSGYFPIGKLLDISVWLSSYLERISRVFSQFFFGRMDRKPFVAMSGPTTGGTKITDCRNRGHGSPLFCYNFQQAGLPASCGWGHYCIKRNALC